MKKISGYSIENSIMKDACIDVLIKESTVIKRKQNGKKH